MQLGDLPSVAEVSLGFDPAHFVLAQEAGLVLPLTGATDQLIKLFSARDVKELLYEPECTYLGRKIKAMTPEEGGLG